MRSFTWWSKRLSHRKPARTDWSGGDAKESHKRKNYEKRWKITDVEENEKENIEYTFPTRR